MSETAQERFLPSPCVGICRLDPETGWCLGCARTAEELGLWRDLPPDAQRAVWADLPRRKALLGLTFRLLPWQGESLLDWLADTSRQSGARWSIGVHGAVAEFAVADGATLRCERTAGSVLLHTQGGDLRLNPPAGTRAFELLGQSGRVERVVVALHRARVSQTLAPFVTELGADHNSIDPGRRDERLFDLGLNRPPIRFCVRTSDPALLAALRAAAGHRALDPATGLVAPLLRASPDRVVTSPAGRIEVSGPILRQGHSGPHTHLLPNLLTQEPPLMPGLELPEGYLACATLVPGR